MPFVFWFAENITVITSHYGQTCDNASFDLSSLASTKTHKRRGKMATNDYHSAFTVCSSWQYIASSSSPSFSLSYLVLFLSVTLFLSFPVFFLSYPLFPSPSLSLSPSLLSRIFLYLTVIHNMAPSVLKESTTNLHRLQLRRYGES